jgi:redox-sensing transcriptional repressor
MKKMTAIPAPSISRLCTVYGLLWELEHEKVTSISSSVLGARLGVGAHNIRKDINYLGEIGNTGAGYEVAALRRHIERQLGLELKRKACIVGLGRLGSALLNYKKFFTDNYRIVAGFDSNINRLETIRTSIKLYPAYEITDIVRRERIEMAIIAVPADVAQGVADRLLGGGVRGLINFAPTVIRTEQPDIFIRNIDIINEFRILATCLKLEEIKKKT